MKDTFDRIMGNLKKALGDKECATEVYSEEIAGFDKGLELMINPNLINREVDEWGGEEGDCNEE